MLAYGILFDRFAKKKWEFLSNLLMFPWILFVAIIIAWMSDMYAGLHVETKIPHEWKEHTLLTQNIEDISRSREQEGYSILLFGKVKERETFRYTVINYDGTKKRDKIYAADCIIHKSTDGKQRIEEVRKVREYKNPQDKKFYENRYDRKESFYRVYL